MSFYTLFKGWLPLGPPVGFFALLVLTRPLYLTVLPFLSYSVCKLQKLGHATVRSRFWQLIKNSESTPPV